MAKALSEDQEEQSKISVKSNQIVDDMDLLREAVNERSVFRDLLDYPLEVYLYYSLYYSLLNPLVCFLHESSWLPVCFFLTNKNLDKNTCTRVQSCVLSRSPLFTSCSEPPCRAFSFFRKQQQHNIFFVYIYIYEFGGVGLSSGTRR